MLGSFRGIPFKIMAIVLAVIALGAGIWMTFIQSAGFQSTKATIISIEDDPDYVPDPNTENDKQRIVTVKYTVDGKDYTRTLDSYSSTYQVGSEVDVQYDPKDPGTVHSSPIFGIVLMIIGGVIVLILIIVTVKKSLSVKKLKEVQNDTVYLPPEKGEERELYFITDVGTPKYGHRIEDKNRRVLYEAKMTKFTVSTPFGFDFIDHEHGTKTPHLVGHEEASEWNSLLIDNHYTFTLDGEDIWKHLKRNGISVESKFAEGKVLTTAYAVKRNGEKIADFMTSGQYVHEDDAEKHKIAGNVPVRGFYRIHTREKNLDLLFVTILAFARSGAADDKGGQKSILFNAMKNR